jgi:hypothetical protein
MGSRVFGFMFRGLRFRGSNMKFGRIGLGYGAWGLECQGFRSQVRGASCRVYVLRFSICFMAFTI